MAEEDANVKIIDITPSDLTSRRGLLIRRIEDRVRELLEPLPNGDPSLSFDDGKYSGWSSSMWESSRQSEGPRVRTMRFTGFRGRTHLALVMYTMADVHQRLVRYKDTNDDKFYITKRSFFYRLKNDIVKRFTQKMSQVEAAINKVTLLLDCGPWEIGFISSSKGLVVGDLTLQLGNKRSIQCDKSSSRAVPDVVTNVTQVRTSADYVLVVEKDSVFQKLLREGCSAINNCILVTGKGYPDVATRMLVHLLSEKARLPVYALVDCNPYGFEIMCVYRFGTLNNLGFREQLLCPRMRWLGVHQQDLQELEVPTVPLTSRDFKKIRHLESRNYIDDNFRQQLQAMKSGKAEIESIIMFGEEFITEKFIPKKIQKESYV